MLTCSLSSLSSLLGGKSTPKAQWYLEAVGRQRKGRGKAEERQREWQRKASEKPEEKKSKGRAKAVERQRTGRRRLTSCRR